MATQKKVTPSLEDYLEAIYNLSLKTQGVRLVDVSELLNISKPSVSKALDTLKQMDFIIHERYSLIYLTKSGEKRAKEVTSRHHVIKEFLQVVLKLEEHNAEEEACKIEHAMSNNTVAKIVEFLNKYEEK